MVKSIGKGSFEIQMPIQQVILAKADGTPLYYIELESIPSPGDVLTITVPGKIELETIEA